MDPSEVDLSAPVPGEENYSSGELMAALHAAHADNNNDAVQTLTGMLHRNFVRQRGSVDPTADMSGTERFVAGMGHGMKRLGEGAANLVGLKGQAGVFDSSDEGLRNEDQTARALLNTRGGFWGDLAGQAAATAPLGMGTGAALRAGGAALGRTALNPTVAKVLINALKTGTAAGEGAFQGGAMADPDEQGSEAGKGAILGGALSKLGQTGGRVLRGIVGKSQPLQELERDVAQSGRDVFVPVSQGAESGGLSGATKQIYQHVLPFALGVEGRLGGQSERAAETARNAAADIYGRPSFLREAGGVKSTASVAGKTAEETAANLSDTHAADLKKAFDDYAFESPLEGIQDQVKRHLEVMHPNIPEAMRDKLAATVDSNLALYSKEGQITGENLRAAMDGAKGDMDSLGRKFRGDWKDSALQGMRNIIDDTIEHHQDILKTTGSAKEASRAQQFIEDMANYKALAAHDPTVAAIVRATEGAPAERGAYQFKNILTQLPHGSPEYKFYQNAHELLRGEEPGSVTPAGRHMWHTMGSLVGPLFTGISTGHAGAGMLGPALFTAGSHALASEPVQRIMYGEGFGGGQRALAETMKRFPQVTRSTGAAARAAVVGRNEKQNEEEE